MCKGKGRAVCFCAVRSRRYRSPGAVAGIFAAFLRQILRLILAHAENKTLIMVTHRLTAIEQFDELCVIDEAKLIEKGTYAELLQLEKGFFKQLVERV